MPRFIAHVINRIFLSLWHLDNWNKKATKQTFHFGVENYDAIGACWVVKVTAVRKNIGYQTVGPSSDGCLYNKNETKFCGP